MKNVFVILAQQTILLDRHITKNRKTSKYWVILTKYPFKATKPIPESYLPFNLSPTNRYN